MLGSTQSWQSCDASVSFLDPDIGSHYTDAWNTCLVNPDRAMRYMQRCLIGKTSRQPACVAKCQSAAAAPTFPTCQATCGAIHCRGCTGVPGCVKNCEAQASSEAFTSCYNVCQVALRLVSNTGSFAECMTGSTVLKLPGCLATDPVLWGRCGQIAKRVGYPGTGSNYDAWRSCVSASML